MRRYKAELMRDEMAYTVTDRDGDAVLGGYFSLERAREIANALNAVYEQGVKAGTPPAKQPESAEPAC
mgnify:CR=1 FL=1